MQFDYTRPIFLQVADDIKREIATGTLPPGEKLPPVTELSLRYGINPNTMQRVFRELEGAGVVYIKRGVGAFVSQDEGLCETLRASLVRTLASDFFSGMKKLGYDPAQSLGLLKNMESEILRNADI